MEYIETSDGQIQADFARRVGQVLLHYEAGMTHRRPLDCYEATLTICLLQSLLTTCVELINSKSKKDRTGLVTISGQSISEDPARFGLNMDCITQQWHSDRDLTYRECLRNALSHPLPQQSGTHKTTGYTSWKSASGEIEGFTFVHSPWVNRTGSDVQPRYKVGEADLNKLEYELRSWSSRHDTSGLTVVPIAGRRHQIYLGANPFVPVLQLDLSTTQLRTLTLTLSEHLAEPLAQPQPMLTLTHHSIV